MTKIQGKGYDSKTCLCCMCRCGDHKCFQQLVSKLPLLMQLELKSKAVVPQERSKKEVGVYEADLYRKSIYKRDFCEQPEIIDQFPLEQKEMVTNLRHFSGYCRKESIYRDDFIPWSREEQELCRGKLHLPDHVLEKVPEDKHGQEPEEKISKEHYNYYCPPHCIGNSKEEPKVNCLIDYREKFNIGQQRQIPKLDSDKPRQPFTKFTNYRLDYKGSQLSPRQQRKDRLKVQQSPCPMATETSYRSAFTCPPDNQVWKKPDSGKSAKEQSSNLTVGEGPMLRETTAMLDFKDPDVSAYRPVRQYRDVYKPPERRMETTTTTGSSYPRWKGVPNKTKPQKCVENACNNQKGDDIRCLVTTYQEDFDGLNFALCPCKVAEKYGPKYLKPRYCYRESEKLHDIFHYNKKICEPKNSDCPH